MKWSLLNAASATMLLIFSAVPLNAQQPMPQVPSVLASPVPGSVNAGVAPVPSGPGGYQPPAMGNPGYPPAGNANGGYPVGDPNVAAYGGGNPNAGYANTGYSVDPNAAYGQHPYAGGAQPSGYPMGQGNDYSGYGEGSFSGEAPCEDCNQGWFEGRRRCISSYWGGFDTLLWFNKGRSTPALVTTGNTASEGVLGRPTTTVLFGNERIGSDAQIGGRINFGGWFDDECTKGVGFRFTALEGDRTRFDRSSNGSLVLARPFYNVSLPGEDSLLIGIPGNNSGFVSIRTQNDFLTGDVFGRMNVWAGGNNRIDVIGGYQFARLDDSLIINSSTTVINPQSFLLNTRFDVHDSFSTTNEFHGGLIGLMGERRNGRAKVSYLGKVAIGNMREVSTISGNTNVNIAGGGVTALNGGLLTQTSNIGVYERNRVAFIPEVNLNLHYQLTQRLDVSVGYSAIYLSNVALSGDQIDRNLNLTQQGGVLAGAARPSPVFRDTDFWFQGVNFGANFVY